LIQEPCLEYRTVRVGDPSEVTENGDTEGSAVAGRKCREGRKTMRMLIQQA